MNFIADQSSQSVVASSNIPLFGTANYIVYSNTLAPYSTCNVSSNISSNVTSNVGSNLFILLGGNQTFTGTLTNTGTITNNGTIGGSGNINLSGSSSSTIISCNLNVSNIQQAGTSLNNLLSNTSNYSLNLLYSNQKQFPSKIYDSSTAETTTTFLSKTVYVETFTINTYTRGYDIGTYTIYSSSIFGTINNVNTKKLLFNYNTSEVQAAAWTNGNYTAGVYNQTNYILSNYLGEWLIIKLPAAIILTKFRFYNYANAVNRAPGEWRCYGSMDGITFVEITEGNNLTPITSSDYPSGYYDKILASTFNTSYLYLGWCINKLAGGEAFLHFQEIQIFGNIDKYLLLTETQTYSGTLTNTGTITNNGTIGGSGNINLTGSGSSITASNLTANFNLTVNSNITTSNINSSNHYNSNLLTTSNINVTGTSATSINSAGGITATGLALGSTGDITTVRNITSTGLITTSSKIGIGTTNPISTLHIYEATGTDNTNAYGSITLQHGNSGGVSSILFQSAANSNSDFGYIKFIDNVAANSSYSTYNYFGTSGVGYNETAALIIGCGNDASGVAGPDSVILNPSGSVVLAPQNSVTYISGNVGIGITNPSSSLVINGNISGGTILNTNFKINCYDNNHFIYFNQQGNILQIQEYGTVNFTIGVPGVTILSITSSGAAITGNLALGSTGDITTVRNITSTGLITTTSNITATGTGSTITASNLTANFNLTVNSNIITSNINSSNIYNSNLLTTSNINVIGTNSTSINSVGGITATGLALGSTGDITTVRNITSTGLITTSSNITATGSGSSITASNLTANFNLTVNSNITTSNLVATSIFYNGTQLSTTLSSYLTSTTLNSCNYLTAASLGSTYLQTSGGQLSGNLGIGTSAAAQNQLSIYTTSSSASNQLLITSTSNSASIQLNNGITSNANIGIGCSNIAGNYQNNMFLETTNSIIFNTGGINASASTPEMIISSTGNVGIGLTNPSTTLQVNGTMNATTIQENGTALTAKYLQLSGGTTTGSVTFSNPTGGNPINITSTSTTGNNCLKIQNNSSYITYLGLGGTAFGGNYQNNFFIESTTGAIILNSSNRTSTSTPSMIINSSGYVGINVASPSQILQVGGAGRLRIANSDSDYSILGSADVDGTTNTRIVLSGNTRTSFAGNIDYTATSTGNHIWYTGGSTEKMRMLANGNLGIGTNSATQQLHLNGGALYITGNATNPGTTSGATFWNQSGVGPTISGLTFCVQVNGTTEAMRIDSTGKLGIGTNNPSTLLHVAGTITGNALALGSTGDITTVRNITSTGLISTTSNVGIGTATANNLLSVYNSTSSSSSSNQILITSTSNFANIQFNNGITSNANIGIGCSNIAGNYSNNMYLETNNSIVFNTGGVNASSTTPDMIISSNGNVGIGTTNPNSIFQVGNAGRLRIGNGTTDYSIIGTLDTDNNATNSKIFISGNTCTYAGTPGSIQYFATSTGVHAFYNGTNQIATINSIGNLSCSNLNLGSTADIQTVRNIVSTGQISTSSNINVTSTSSTSINSAGGITATGLTLGSTGDIITVRNITSTGFITTTGNISTTGTGSITSAGGLSLGTTDISTVRNINSTGIIKTTGLISTTSNIGIGTTTANCRLQLATESLGKQICLYEVTNNNYNFIGFGNGGGMILQINDPVNDAFIFNVANNGTAATGNNELMRLKATGKLGIGTNPFSTLHIYEATGTDCTSTNGTIILQHGNSGGVSSIVFPSTVNSPSDYAYIKYIENVSSTSSYTQYNYFGSTGTETGALILGCENDYVANSGPDSVILNPKGNIVLDPGNLFTYINGSVGIGTTNPSQLLDVYTTNLSTNNYIRVRADAGREAGIKFNRSGTEWSIYNRGSGYIGTGQVDNLTIQNNSLVPVLEITQAGNIGIGTSTNLTNNIVSVYNSSSGATSSNQLLITSTSNYANIQFNNGITSNARIGLGCSNIPGNYSNNMFLETNNAIVFNTGGVNANLSTPDMIILSNGNVGIGLTNPTTSLQVVGTLNSTIIQENGVNLTTKYQANVSATSTIANTNTRSYPPTYLTSATTTITNSSYGNGTYIATAGSTYPNLGQEFFQCIGSNPSQYPGVAQWTSASGTINTSGNYIGTNSTLINGTAVTGETATIQLPYNVVINSYSLTANGNSPYNTASPNTWYFCGSTDGTNYTQLDYRTGVTYPVNASSYTTSNFTFTNTTGYNYYRFVIKSTSSTSYPSIICDGMTLFGYEARNGALIGTVGIGTTSLAYNSSFEVYGGYTYLSSSVGIGTSPTGTISLIVSGTTVLNSNVGIGTTYSTSYPLDVYNSTVLGCRVQTGSANGYLVLSGGTGGSMGYVNFYKTDGTRGGYIGYGANLTNYIDLASEGGFLGYRANCNLIVGSQLGVGNATAAAISGTNTLSITGNSYFGGNLGIGTGTANTNIEIYHATNPKIFLNQNSNVRCFLSGNTNGLDLGNDLGTGIIRFMPNNVEKIRIDSAGNLGIGTATSQTLFHMYGTNPILTIMAQGGGGAISQLNLATYSNPGYTASCSLIATDNGSGGNSFQVNLKTSGNVNNTQFIAFYISPSGNIGIGTTTNLNTILTVSGQITANGLLLGTNDIGTVRNITSTGAITTTSNVSIGTTNSTSKLCINPNVYDNNAFDFTTCPCVITHQTASSTTILNDPQPVLHLCRQGTSAQSYGQRATFKLCRYENNATNSRTKLDIVLAENLFADVSIMSIYSGGTVTIGNPNINYTNYPNTSTCKLYVNAGIASVGTCYPLRISAGAAADTNANATILGLGTENNGWSKVGIAHVRTSPYDVGDLVFLNNSDATGSSDVNLTHEKMRIKSSGSIGIGTNNPQTTLDVRGTIYIKGSSGMAAPTNAIYGGTGERIVLWNGDASNPPYSFGINTTTLWYAVPSGAIHMFYVGGTSYLTISTTGLSTTGLTATSLTLNSTDILSVRNITSSGNISTSSNITTSNIIPSVSTNKIAIKSSIIGESPPTSYFNTLSTATGNLFVYSSNNLPLFSGSAPLTNKGLCIINEIVGSSNACTLSFQSYKSLQDGPNGYSYAFIEFIFDITQTTFSSINYFNLTTTTNVSPPSVLYMSTKSSTPATSNANIDISPLGYLSLTPKMNVTYIKGSVGIGTTNPGTALDVSGKINVSNGVALPSTGITGGNGDRIILYPGTGVAGAASAQYPYAIGVNTTTYSSYWFSCPSNVNYIWYTSNVSNMVLDTTGTLNVWNDVIGFNSASDFNLKTNIKPLNVDCTELINKIKPVEFNWKDIDTIPSEKRNKLDYGFIAQDIEKLLPNLVKDLTSHKIIKYEKFAPYLVKAIQEINEKIDKLIPDIEPNIYSICECNKNIIKLLKKDIIKLYINCFIEIINNEKTNKYKVIEINLIENEIKIDDDLEDNSCFVYGMYNSNFETFNKNNYLNITQNLYSIINKQQKQIDSLIEKLNKII